VPTRAERAAAKVSLDTKTMLGDGKEDGVL